MPFTYEDTLQGERRNAVTIPAARKDVLTEQFAQSFEENPIMALRRFSQLAEDQVTGPRLSAETARARLKDAGMENDLVINEGGITDAALTTLMERKRVEKRRQEIFARSEGGAGELASRFGIAFATTLADPVSAGLNFVPVVGQARYAKWLNTARSLGGRVAVRGAVGAAEGAAGAAIAEIPIYAMRTQEQADYDMVDSLLNVAFGGVIGAGLHTTVGTAGELISRRMPARTASSVRAEPFIGESRAAEPLPADVQRAIFAMGDMERAVDNLSSGARQAALRTAVGQAAEGRPINVEPIVAAAPVRQTDTPEFRQWFGESKAVDAAGEPAVLYHGTASDVSEFRSSTDGSLGPGIYLTREPAYANSAAETAFTNEFYGRRNERAARNVMPVYAALKNPANTSAPDFPSLQGKALQEELIRRGHDGIVTGDMSEVVAFRPEQIKSAVGNSGRFDPKSASLTDPVDTEFKAAIDHAETTLAREVESGTEANLKAAEEEADLAVADVTELTKRLDVDMKADADFAAVLEGVEKAERWARVAELATVCLVRGG